MGDHEQAARWYAQCLEAYRDFEWYAGMSMTYRGMGDVALLLGNEAGARQQYRAALQNARQAGEASPSLDALSGVAELLSHSADRERPVELLAFVLRHEACSHLTRRRAEHLLSLLVSQLTPEAIEAARERSRHTTLEALVANVLAEIGNG